MKGHRTDRRKTDMKWAKRAAAYGIAAAMTVGALAGCGQSGSETTAAGGESGTESAAGETSAAKSADGEQITLRFSWWGSDTRHQATLDCIKAFEEANPNIKIEAEYSGFDGYQDKLSAALSGGTEADIVQVDQPWMGTFVAQNPDFFVDLNDYKDDIDLSGFSQDFLKDFCVYNDKLYCLPSGTNALSLLMNKAVLEKAGASFGDTITWEDIDEQGKKVNQADPESYLLNMDTGMFYYFTRIYLMQKTNKQLINEDYSLGVTVDDLEDAFAYTKKLYDDKVVIPLEESMIFYGSPQDNPKWNNNQLGGWLTWSSQVDQQKWGDNAEVLPYPEIAGAENSGVIVRPSMVMAVSKRSEHPDAAVKFLDFMMNQDAGILALKDTRSVPSTEHARKVLEDNNLLSPLAKQAVELAMKNPGTPEVYVANTTEVLNTFNSVMEKLIYGQYPDAKSAAEDAYQQMSDMLATIKADAQ